MSIPTVDLYVDPVSPYSWLALATLDAFRDAHPCAIAVRPVVYGALLSATGLVGPVETPAKRAYTFHDVARTATALGLPCAGPPAHPFRSLEALRLVTDARRTDPDAALALATALCRATWERGEDLTDPDVLGRYGPVERVSAPDVKAALRAETEAALARGVFGVPTFALGDELFWGHDRMPALGAALDGARDEPTLRARSEALRSRPSGIQRRR